MKLLQSVLLIVLVQIWGISPTASTTSHVAHIVYFNLPDIEYLCMEIKWYHSNYLASNCFLLA